MNVCGLHHVQIAMPAGHEAEARAFYAGLVGLAEISKPPHQAARGGCWFRLGDRELHLGVDPAFRPSTKAHVALLVADLAATRRQLEAAGVATREDEPLPGYARFYADDPFGNRLEFLTPVTV
jgi:catechol 2,3-dioxygenase-like lactoylglutathione lyase family enzyme